MSGRGYRRGGSYGAAAGLAPAVADRPGPDLTQLEEVTDEELLALLPQCWPLGTDRPFVLFHIAPAPGDILPVAVCKP